MRDNTQNNDANGIPGGFSETDTRAALHVAVLSTQCLSAIIMTLVAEAMTTRAEILVLTQGGGAPADAARVADALQFRAKTARAAAESLARLVDKRSKSDAGTEALNHAVDMVGEQIARGLAKAGVELPDDDAADTDGPARGFHGRN